MKKYFLILTLLSGCYSAKHANNDLDKAKIKYPIEVAKKCHDWYPIDTIKITTDTSSYAAWKNKLDSINESISSIISDTIKDTIIRNIFNKEIITKYQTIFKQMPAIHDTIHVIDKARQEYDKLRASEAENKLLDNYKLMNKVFIFGLFLLLILFIIAVLKK